jgi:ADP-ribose pyrophosphatase YjhB (NUDIX family)
VANKGKTKMKFCPKCGGDLKSAEIDGRSRLGCSSQTCDYVFWDNPTPVVAALVEREGIVVLVRNKEWPQKIYGLVSGFLEKNETPESGILREVKEELGLNGQIDDFIGCYSFFELNLKWCLLKNCGHGHSVLAMRLKTGWQREKQGWQKIKTA